jgi:hypothetical protein
MRSVLLAASMLLALGAAQAMAKPTATEIEWNLRAVLAPEVDLGIARQAPQPRPAPDLPATARAGGHQPSARRLS